MRAIHLTLLDVKFSRADGVKVSRSPLLPLCFAWKFVPASKQTSLIYSYLYFTEILLWCSWIERHRADRDSACIVSGPSSLPCERELVPRRGRATWSRTAQSTSPAATALLQQQHTHLILRRQLNLLLLHSHSRQRTVSIYPDVSINRLVARNEDCTSILWQSTFSKLTI